MTCPSDAELARALTLGADPPIAAHVATCPACREAWDGARQAIELARQLPVALPPPAHREEVRTAVLAAAAGVTRRPARRAWLAPVIAGAAAAGVLGFLALHRTSPPPPPAHRAHGTVHPHPGARYLASSAGPDEIVRLSDGAIDVEVEPLLPGERFRVIAGASEIEVRGTAFTATASEERLVGVTVARGRVEVRPQTGAPAVLGTGESWRAALVAEAVASPPASLAIAPPLGPRVIAPPPASTAIASSPASTAIAPLPPPSPSRTAPAPRPHHAAVLTSPSTAHSVTAPEPHPFAPLAPPPGAPVAHVGPGDEAATPGDPAPTSPKPSDAPARTPEELSYDQAWEALRANQFARAASEFSRVLLLAPDSPLAEDASFWHAVALARGKRSAEALSAFRDFLDTYARSARAGEASAMLGWILIDARAYDEAARRFRAATGDPSPAVRASAQAGLEALGSLPCGMCATERLSP